VTDLKSIHHQEKFSTEVYASPAVEKADNITNAGEFAKRNNVTPANLRCVTTVRLTHPTSALRPEMKKILAA